MGESNLYEMSLLDDMTSSDVNYDCLMLGGGSDARAYEVLEKAQEKGFSFKRIILFDFEERKNAVEGDVKKAYGKYSELHSNITLLPCSIRDPSRCLKAMESEGVSITRDSNVAMDISCFTRPYSFSLLKYLQERCHLESVDVYYTEPMSYLMPKGLISSYRASLGPLFVMEVPGFPGSSNGKSKTVLVVTLGFDGDLSAFISDEITPDWVVIVNGFPSYAPKFKDISLINNERLLNSSNAKERVAYCGASNPYEVYNCLSSLRKEFPDAFFNIAPLGPKPMAIGACMFALADSSVRVVYPMPEKYANTTTDKCWQSWRYVVPLGSRLNLSIVNSGSGI